MSLMPLLYKTPARTTNHTQLPHTSIMVYKLSRGSTGTHQNRLSCLKWKAYISITV